MGEAKDVKQPSKNQPKEKKLSGKELIREALLTAIRTYRLIEKVTFQESNPKIAKMIGFTQIALKELEGLN